MKTCIATFTIFESRQLETPYHTVNQFPSEPTNFLNIHQYSNFLFYNDAARC